MGDSLELAFHINPQAKWHDGRDVTARDVQFTFALNKNPALGGRLGTELANIDSVTVTDSLTAVFWFHQRSPTQFLDAAAQMLILPAHQLEKIPVGALAGKPADTRSGPADSGCESGTRGLGGDRRRYFQLSWTAETEPRDLECLAGLHSRGHEVVRRRRGRLRMALRPDELRQLARHRNVRPIPLPGMDYAFLRFNLRDPANKARPHPLFGDRDLRRAITMSLNRGTLARSVLDTFALVPVGPIVRAYSITDPRGGQLPFDSARAPAGCSIPWAGSDRARTERGRKTGSHFPSRSLSRPRARSE